MIRLNSSNTIFFDNFSTNELIREIKEANEDVELSWLSHGGSTSFGQEFARFLGEHAFKVDADIAGIVASMGVFALPFFNHVKGANQSDLMIHSPFTRGEAPTEHTMQFFYKALLKKVDKEKFAEITGHKLKDVVFAKGDNRINVWITGKEAKTIGFYDESYDLLDKAADLTQPIPSTEFLGYDIPSEIKEKYAKKTKNIIIPTKNNNNNDMDIKTLTKEALKEGNPTLFAEIAIEERLRISKIAKYLVVDEKKAQSLIDGGNALSIEDVEYFMEKKAGLDKVADLENDESDNDFVPTRNVKTQKTENLTDEQKEAKERTAALEEVAEESGLSADIKRITGEK